MGELINLFGQHGLPGLEPPSPRPASTSLSEPSRPSTANPWEQITASGPFVRPREIDVCWSCGTYRAKDGKDYCWRCIKAGMDNPFIQCMYFEECSTVAKRRHRGQQYFICKRHKEKQ